VTIAVIDAAAVVDVLCRYGPAVRVERSMRAASDVVAPAHLDAEVFQAWLESNEPATCPRSSPTSMRSLN
jgi:predicted nucleic acid-binding protein